MTKNGFKKGVVQQRFAELRADSGENRRITGRAIVFDSPAMIDGFREVILPQAVSDELLADSDVLLTLEHNPTAGILGRSNHGEGTLQLERADDGVYVTCTLPDTSLGDAVLEGIRRGDYSQMSFCFTVGQQSWQKCDDGIEQRTIESIDRIYDVSIVALPAYKDTSVVARSEAQFPEEQQDETEDETEEEKSEETEAQLEDETEEELEEELEEEKSEEIEAQLQDDTEENNDNDNEMKDTSKKDEEQKRSRSNVFIPRSARRSSNNISLMRIIRSQMRNGAEMNETEKEYCRRGEELMSRANLDFGGGVVLGVDARSAVINASTATAGAEAVATDTLNILEPLYNNLALSQAGCTMMFGLVGNIKLPAYSGSSAGWAAETAEAADGKGTFSEITFSPKRLTAYIDISNQFLIQDSVNAEALLRSDLAMALQQKLESTILGEAAGSDTQPAGLFNGVTTEITPTYAQMVKMEQQVEELNVTGELRYIMSPAIKAALRSTPTDAGSGRFIMEGNDVNGIPALVTNNAKGIILGNFSDFVLCQWGGIELIVDSLTLASKAMTRIVINSYWDAKPRRNAFAKAKLAVSD